MLTFWIRQNLNGKKFKPTLSNLTPMLKESFSTTLTNRWSAFWAARQSIKWWSKKTSSLMTFLSSMSSSKTWVRNKWSKKPLFTVSWTATFWISCHTAPWTCASYPVLWCLSSLKISKIFLHAWKICVSTKTSRSCHVEKNRDAVSLGFKPTNFWKQAFVITPESTLYLANSTPDANRIQV